MAGIYRVNDTEQPFLWLENTPKMTFLDMKVSNVTPGLAEGEPALDSARLDELTRQLQLTRFVVQCVLVPIILTVGVTGNLLSIAVLTRRWMRSSTNYYLTILAVYDLLYLISAFTLGLKHYTDVTGLRWYNIYKYHFGIPFTNTCSNTGVWLTLTFTIERYIVVCHPMRGKALCTPERARYIIMVVCAVAAILTVPDFFAKRVASAVRAVNGANVTLYGPEATDLAQNASFSVGFNYLSQVLFTFLPLVLLMIFNSLLIRAVMMATRQRKSMAQLVVVQSERQERHSRDQHRITVMLITVVIVFLLCQTPQAVQNVLLAYYIHNDQLTPERHKVFTITANIFNLFVIVNSAVNFVLYSALSTKFRRTFSRLFCRCVKDRKSPAELLFSEAGGATVHSSPADDSRKHLLQGARKAGVAYNWPRPADKNHPGVGCTDPYHRPSGHNTYHRAPPNSHPGHSGPPNSFHGNSGPSNKNGYMDLKQNVQNIVSCV